MIRSLRTTSFSLGVSLVLAFFGATASVRAQAYPIDCAILLCLSGGWPHSAPCSQARADSFDASRLGPLSRRCRSGVAPWARLIIRARTTKRPRRSLTFCSRNIQMYCHRRFPNLLKVRRLRQDNLSRDNIFLPGPRPNERPGYNTYNIAPTSTSAVRNSISSGPFASLMCVMPVNM
jgi:hypothetical protein